MKSLFPIIPYENVMIAWDNFSGTVWVTMLTVLERHDFGRVVDGVMEYSSSGLILKNILESVHLFFPSMAIPAFVVFPNGFEAMIMMHNTSPDGFDDDQIGEKLYDLIHGFRRVTVSSLNSWTPVNIDVWIHKLREIECEEVPMVYEIYENRLKEWCKFGY